MSLGECTALSSIAVTAVLTMISCVMEKWKLISALYEFLARIERVCRREDILDKRATVQHLVRACIMAYEYRSLAESVRLLCSRCVRVEDRSRRERAGSVAGEGARAVGGIVIVERAAWCLSDV